MSLQEPTTAAVFGRQIPRPSCQAVYAHDYERCFGPARESAAWAHFFSMVSSGLRKDIWSQRGFLEKMQYSEDDEYTRWCRAQGYQVVYCPESVVMHSHNYTPGQAYRRSFGEARALAAVWEGTPDKSTGPEPSFSGWLNDIRRDFLFCAKNHRLSEVPHAVTDSLAAAALPGWPGSGRVGVFIGNRELNNVNSERFTKNGSRELETQLYQTCQLVLAETLNVVPRTKLEG